MAVHKLLVDDFQDDSFILLAIHCTIEDYRIAYLINKKLQINLQRKEQDLDFKYTKANYSIYEWEDLNNKTIWNLVSNICKKEENVLGISETLFTNQQQIVRQYNLIPELKKTNFLLKIENDYNLINTKPIIDKIQAISQVITTYEIKVNDLISSNNLIYN
jgi:hypothetical protein